MLAPIMNTTVLLYMSFAVIIIILSLWIFFEEIHFIYRHRKELCTMPWWVVNGLFAFGSIWLGVTFALILHTDFLAQITLFNSLVIGATDISHAVLVRPGIIIILSAILTQAIITRKSGR